MSASSEQPGPPAEPSTAPQTAEPQTAPTTAAPAWTPPAAPQDPPPAATPDATSGGPAAVVSERPEIAIGGAFAGGFVFALILKRLAR